MKNLLSILSTIILLFMFSCGGGSSSSEEKSEIYEPKTQEEFVQILDDLGIKPYPGAVITKFSDGSNSEMTYEVAAEENTNKAIIEYYKTAFDKALSGNSDWKRFMSTPISIIYMKGFDLNFGINITSTNAAMEMVGAEEGEGPEKLSFTIFLGDNAVSY